MVASCGLYHLLLFVIEFLLHDAKIRNFADIQTSIRKYFPFTTPYFSFILYLCKRKKWQKTYWHIFVKDGQ